MVGGRRVVSKLELCYEERLAFVVSSEMIVTGWRELFEQPVNSISLFIYDGNNEVF